MRIQSRYSELQLHASSEAAFPISDLHFRLWAAACSDAFLYRQCGRDRPGTLHFEFFNEFDGLQSAQYPDLRQNTANFKINYGLPHELELDLDVPYLSIYAHRIQTSDGPGDTDMGIKWNFHKSNRPLTVPAFSASIYIEFPTGDTSQQLGSGFTDYWLNSIAAGALSRRRRGSMPILGSCSPAIRAPACWVFKTPAATFTPAGSRWCTTLASGSRLAWRSTARGDNKGLGKGPVQGSSWRLVPVQQAALSYFRTSGWQPRCQPKNRRPDRL